MTAFINTILLIVNIISFAATVLFAIFGVYEQIMGPADAEKLLKKGSSLKSVGRKEEKAL